MYIVVNFSGQEGIKRQGWGRGEGKFRKVNGDEKSKFTYKKNLNKSVKQ